MSNRILSYIQKLFNIFTREAAAHSRAIARLRGSLIGISSQGKPQEGER